ncbi:hypothetical protein [Roseibium sediminicola]|uniref:Uncharacterized protein n=1 Tax=Roseibium sediminicola TaxID=2933272 RepID=A0ABT0H223_9HYPH|nr:hypothetical protein [Roseibium sp. CAU 1639]MCK7615525.1 hypothetical protein [Roseibium sp. CAU 1639]
MDKTVNRYGALIEKIFFDRFEEGSTELEFARDDIEVAANALDIALPKNLGDVLYSFRFRISLPDSILETQPDEKEWIIELAGRAV